MKRLNVCTYPFYIRPRDDSRNCPRSSDCVFVSFLQKVKYRGCYLPVPMDTMGTIPLVTRNVSAISSKVISDEIV